MEDLTELERSGQGGKLLDSQVGGQFCDKEKCLADVDSKLPGQQLGVTLPLGGHAA